MAATNMQALLIDELRDILSAERQLLKALPKMAKAARTPALQNAFKEHLAQTEGHVTRLEQAFEALGVAVRAKKCVAMQGLIEEGKELIEEGLDPAILDAALIAAAQKVEHYEIASYGTVRTWAQETGHPEVAKLLEATLREEAATDVKLTNLAKNVINAQAV
ncbi:MAG: ferritin-like domain-containing protein [Actinomycetota bacterium]